MHNSKQKSDSRSQYNTVCTFYDQKGAGRRKILLHLPLTQNQKCIDGLSSAVTYLTWRISKEKHYLTTSYSLIILSLCSFLELENINTTF